MADNIILNVGSGGDVLAAKDETSAKYQRVYISYNKAGTPTDVADPYALCGDGLPVYIMGSGLTGMAVHLTDIEGQNAQTFIGTALLGCVAPIVCPVGSAAHGTADSKWPATNDVPTFDAPVKIGGKANASAPTAVDEDDRVNAWFDLSGRLHVFDESGERAIYQNATGTPNRGVAIMGTDGTNPFLVSVDSTGKLNVLVANTITETNSGAIKTSLQLIDDLVNVPGSGTPPAGVPVIGYDGTSGQFIKTDASGHVQVDILSMPGTDSAGHPQVDILSMPGTDSAGHHQVDVLTMPTVTVTATDLDVRNLTAANDTVVVTGGTGQTADVKVTLDGESVIANAGTNLNTSALALESGGNLAAIAGKDFATETTLALIKAKTDNLDVSLSGGSAKAIVRGGAKGTTTAADATTTSEGTDHQALDVQIMHGGAAKDPTQIRALTSGTDTVTVVQSTAANLKVDASGVAIPVTDNSGSLTVDGSVTVTQATGTNLHLVVDSGTVTTITNVVHVDDNGGSLTVDGPLTDTQLRASAVTVSIATGTNAIGKLAANSGVDIGDVDVTSLPAIPAGSNTIGSVIIASGASGGATAYKLIGAATTNATSVKASAGKLIGYYLSNTNAAARYVKFYNKASAPTVGTDTPVLTLMVPAGGAANLDSACGIDFSTGVAFATTTGAADSDTGAVAANEIIVNLWYK